MTSTESPTDDGQRSAAPPLEGIRVVEAASYVSGPFACQMLAHLGAEVIKVEPPKGDPMRRFGYRYRGLSALFANVSHGKRSVVLDLKDDGCRAEMLDLLADADVFVQNWRPGVAETLGLGYDDVRQRNRRLVYLAITGFGATGPSTSRPAFDTSIQALSGLAAYESADGEATVIRSIVSDKTTAMMAAQAVLAALVARATTGNGARLDLSMLDAMAYFNFPDMAQDRTFLDADPIDLARGRPNVVPTSDGFLAVSPVSGRQLGAAMAAVGHPEWKDELKAAEGPAELMDRLVDRIGGVSRTRSTAEWEETFDDHDVPATPLLGVDAHFADPQTVHNRIYSTGDSPVGPVRRVRYPALVDGRLLPSVAPVPPLDQSP